MKTRLFLLVVLVVGLTAAGWWYTQQGPTPTMYVIVRGDTLWKIAKAHDVTIEQLREWNTLSGDRIDVDQELTLWLGDAPEEIASHTEKASSTSKTRKRKRTRISASAVSAPESSTAAVSLSMPTAQPCLAGPELDAGDGDDPAFASSAGLSHAQIRQAMSPFLPNVFRCVEDGEQPAGTAELSIVVGCSGQVLQVMVTDSGAFSDTLTRCFADTLRYTPFPAHDMPDGFEFAYPLTMSW